MWSKRIIYFLNFIKINRKPYVFLGISSGASAPEKLVQGLLNNLRKDDKPYGLFTLTLDTHHPNGYLSSSCRNKIYKEGTNSILNSIHCADYMAASFIENIINDDSFKNVQCYEAKHHALHLIYQ